MHAVNPWFFRGQTAFRSCILLLCAGYRLIRSDPATLTILLYRPRSRNGATHWPMKRLFSSWPVTSRIKDTAMAARATHRNTSDGSLAVCCSITRATRPSDCCAAFGVLQAPVVLMPLPPDCKYEDN